MRLCAPILSLPPSEPPPPTSIVGVFFRRTYQRASDGQCVAKPFRDVEIFGLSGIPALPDQRIAWRERWLARVCSHFHEGPERAGKRREHEVAVSELVVTS